VTPLALPLLERITILSSHCIRTVVWPLFGGNVMEMVVGVMFLQQQKNSRTKAVNYKADFMLIRTRPCYFSTNELSRVSLALSNNLNCTFHSIAKRGMGDVCLSQIGTSKLQIVQMYVITYLTVTMRHRVFLSHRPTQICGCIYRMQQRPFKHSQ
jgi:hypothetical protein